MRAFRLFSQEYEEDNVIKVSKVEEVLAEMDQMLVACGEHMEINVAELIVLLKSREKNGYVNYKEFIDEAFGSENWLTVTLIKLIKNGASRKLPWRRQAAQLLAESSQEHTNRAKGWIGTAKTKGWPSK